MALHADRIEEILKEFREHYKEQVIENLAHRSIMKVQSELELDRKPTMDEFEYAFTKKLQTQVMHEAAFWFMDDVGNFNSAWSGGHSVTNMLEQEKRKVITKIFSRFHFDDNIERGIVNKAKEILMKWESQ